MKRTNLVTRCGAFAAIFALATFGAVAQDEEATVELKVGDEAPDFKLPGSDGNDFSVF